MVLYAPAKSIVLSYKEKLESKLSNKNLRGVFKYFRQWTFKIRIYSKVIQQALVFLHKGSNSFFILLEQFVDSLEIYKYYWRVCVCLCVCVCVCVRPFTVKASSVWISWITRDPNFDVLRTLISYAISLHRYVRMKHLTFLTSHFILLTH